MPDQPAMPANGRRIGRRIAAAVAVLLAVVLLLVATVGLWARRTVLNTDRIVAAVDSAVSDPQVTNALAERISEELVTSLNVETVLAAVLPPKFDAHAPTAAAAVNDAIGTQIATVVNSPQGRQLLNAAVRTAHSTAVRLLNGEGLAPNSLLSVTDGQVTLDVVPLIGQSLQYLQTQRIIPPKYNVSALANVATSTAMVNQMAATFGVSLPPTFGQIVLLDSQQVSDGEAVIADVQEGLALFRKATQLLVVAALVCVALAMIASVNRRRTLVQLLVGIGLGAVALRVGLSRVVTANDHAIDEVGIKVAAMKMTESLTLALSRMLVLMAVLALVAAIVLHLLRSRRGNAAVATAD